MSHAGIVLIFIFAVIRFLGGRCRDVCYDRSPDPSKLLLFMRDVYAAHVDVELEVGLFLGAVPGHRIGNLAIPLAGVKILRDVYRPARLIVDEELAVAIGCVDVKGCIETGR